MRAKDGNGNVMRCKKLSTSKFRIWTLRIWSCQGPGFCSARQVLCGDASRLFLDHFAKYLGSVLGRTELCHEVRYPWPQKPQIIHKRKPPFGTARKILAICVLAAEILCKMLRKHQRCCDAGHSGSQQVSSPLGAHLLMTCSPRVTE